MAEKPKIRVERAGILANLVPQRPQDEEGLTRWPTITDLMAPRYLDSVQTRQPGRIAIKVEGSAYRISIECPTEGLQTSLLVDSLVDILERLERHVLSGKATWSQTYAAQKRGRQKVEDLLK